MSQKILRDRLDLAVHGAPPAFADPLHVGRPNIGDTNLFMKLTTSMFDRAWLTNSGPLVEELERELAELLGVRNCVAMCNGTVALEIATRALGLEGEVIVPSFTFIATAHALSWQGITPVFADIDPQTHTLDPAAVTRMITPRTTGIIGVHLWGRPSAIDQLQQVADHHGLMLLFDAAHAFGCTSSGRMIGGFGEAEVHSFHATKVFNTFEGGAVTTDSDELAAKMRLMRNFGFAGTDEVIHPGTNGKMTEVCAAMGLTNLVSLDEVVGANRRRHESYRRALEPIPGISLLDFDRREKTNYHYVVALISEDCPRSRDELIGVLRAENVLARKYFWPGCHRMEPYRSLAPHAGLLLPQTESVASQVLVLPNGSDITESDINVIADVLRIAMSDIDIEAVKTQW